MSATDAALERKFLGPKPMSPLPQPDDDNAFDSGTPAAKRAGPWLLKPASHKTDSSKTVVKVLLHPIAISVYAGLLVFILLAVIQPPFVMSCASGDKQHPAAQAQFMLKQIKRFSWSKALIWSAVVTVACAVMPYIVQWISHARSGPG